MKLRQHIFFRMIDDRVYLTFDDGPDPDTTPFLLDVLAEHDVRATFFVVGRKVRKHARLVRRMVADGHTVGNHSYSHSLMIFKPRWRLEREIIETDEAVQQAAGVHPCWFRPPHGRFGPRLWRVLRDMQRPLALWSASTGDYRKNVDAHTIQGRLHAKAVPGAIILLHDGHRNGPLTLQATRRFLDETRGQNIKLSALQAPS